jgi:uncharacterized protein YaaQ
MRGMSDDNALDIPSNVRVLANGTWQDKTTGHFLRGGNTTTAIRTADDARAVSNARHARKRQVIAQAANEAVERGDYRQRYGDLAFVAALAETAFIKATTADDPKAIEAARFLLRETGLAEADATDTTTGGAAGGVLAQLGAEAVRYLLARAEAQRALDVDE